MLLGRRRSGLGEGLPETELGCKALRRHGISLRKGHVVQP